MTILKRVTQTTAGVAVLAAAVISLNVIASRFHLRGDFTDDQVYSLSQGSKNIAKNLSDEVTAKVYFSRSSKDLPPQFKTYGNRVAEVIREYAVASGGRMRVQVIDPQPDTDEEEWAKKAGVQGISTGQGEDFYLGVVFVSGDREAAIPYLDPRKEEFLEYDLSEALLKLKSTPKPKIGVLSSLPVQGGGVPMMGGGQPPWVVVQGLENAFEVVDVAADATKIDDGIGVVLVVHPKNLPDKTLWALDQFVMRGGRLIAAVDPFSRVDLSMNPMGQQQGRVPQASSSLDKLFAAWGIVYNPQSVVGDQMLATRINAGGEVTSYPFFLSVPKDNIDATSKITAHLKQMLIAEPGAVDVKPDSGIAMEPLIQTSADSGLQQSFMMSLVRPADLARQLAADGKKRTIAGLFSGTFKSAFAAGPPEGVTDASPLKESKEGARVLVVADVDFMADANAVDRFQVGPQTILRPRNDNLNFVFNAADFLGGSEDLLSIRSSGRVARPFTRVAELEKAAQARWKSEDDALTKEINELEEHLNQLQAARTDANQSTLTPEQMSDIQRFRDREAEIKHKRREVRKNLREDIEALGHRLIALNLLVVPALVGIFGYIVLSRRSRRMREARS